MREILFRGKRKDTGEWVHGFYVGDIGDGCHEICDINCITGSRVEVAPETVGQYTGLTDKNGTKIFEGDIIKTHYANVKNADHVEKVVFHNGKFCGLYEKDVCKMWSPLPDGVKHLPQDKTPYMEKCEVIGNIHDNPEKEKGQG